MKRKRAIRRGDLVEVTLLDHYSAADGWTDLQDLERIEPLRCKTVGYVVAADKTHLRLASTIAGIDQEAQQGSLAMTVIRACITGVVVLRRGRGPSGN